ncbi:MAG: heparinase II/III family protein [Verrucomicrobia bacterium]|nr:heparinase II/III family protein [Verrucomicrobiota bacterium]
MKPFVRSCLTIGALLATSALSASAALDPATVAARLEHLPPAHPRLFLAAGAEKALAERVAADPVMQTLRAGLLSEADRALKTTPVKRVLIGRRLLDKSRTALSRVLHLGLAWRLTGRPEYLERARAELVAVAGFADWNPSHFLDVAEMTAAAGIGYDWLYPALDEPTRTLLRDAIVQKGLRPSLKSDSWSRGTNNWNQVCNGGMAVGALAVAESEPALAAQMIARAVNTVPLSMHEYAPDGAYPEGPSYWGYGTTYNVILITALQSVLGTDYGLSAQPGFLATADYYLHVIGPSGYYFNYSDAGRGGSAIAAAMFWFAAQRQQPYLLWNDWAKLASDDSRTSSARGRADPLLLLWIAPHQAKPATPPARSWTGHGVTPVAFHRSGWDRDASFVAIKGGTPSANHAHMDVGAFVMDADGLRWADDLGSQDYNSLESAGIKLWGREQDAERWSVFRLGTSSHNVLQVDGQQQRVSGKAPIVLARDGRTVVDTSSVYAGQLARAQRGVVLRDDRTVLVQDEFTTLDRRASVRWAMVTHADVKITGPGRATLTQAGKHLSFRVLEPADAALAIYPTDPPPAKTDAGNKGTRMIGFEVRPGAQQAQRLVVQLVPASAAAASGPSITPLAEW